MGLPSRSASALYLTGVDIYCTNVDFFEMFFSTEHLQLFCTWIRSSYSGMQTD